MKISVNNATEIIISKMEYVFLKILSVKLMRGLMNKMKFVQPVEMNMF